MIFIVCAVRDRALDAFMSPIFVQAIGVANRSFSDEINRTESAFHSHPDDFDLYQIGSFDDSNGQLTSIDPRVIARGKDVIRPVA